MADVTVQYDYIDWGSQEDRTTTAVRSLRYSYVPGRLALPNLSYTYDGAGNIVSEKELLSDGSTVLREKYTYDGKNQLVRHDSVTQNATFTYSYDKAGNITAVQRYAYTTGTLGAVQETRSYNYSTVCENPHYERGLPSSFIHSVSYSAAWDVWRERWTSEP